MSLAVVAIGGNSLVQSGGTGAIPEQFETAVYTCDCVAELIASGWDVVLTHGNGPQVGNVLLRVELARHAIYPLPLDICDADTIGGMGYMLQQVLGNALQARGITRTVITLVTQVLVDADDPAFDKPDKPIGPFYDAAKAATLRAEHGWDVVEDSGRGWRRVVPSPTPRAIIELDAVKCCAGAGMIPIAVGGGGVPVVRRDGALLGVEAVIDKDRASAMLALALNADLLLISTGVPAIQVDFGTAEARALADVTASELRALYDSGEFPAGSMGPKVDAALQFLDGGGPLVIITDPDHLMAAVAGQAGTRIRRDGTDQP